MKDGFRGLLALTGHHRGRMVLACLGALAGTALAMVPLVVAARMAVAPALAWVWLLAGCLVAHPMAMGVSTALAHHAAFDILHDVRLSLSERLTRLPLGYFTRRQAGALKRVLNEDVEVLELFLSHQLPDMAACLGVPLATLAAIAWADWRLGLASLVILPPAYGAQWAMMRGHGARMAEYFGRIGAINGRAVEYVRGIEQVKSTRGGILVIADIAQHIEGLRHFAEGWFGLWGRWWSTYAVVVGAAPLAVVPAALIEAQTGAAGIPTLIFALFAATGLGAPLVKLTIYGEITQRVLLARSRIAALHDAALLPVPAVPAEPADSTLQFEAVGLAADGRLILDAITLRIPAGRLTAIVGPSGAGKTSLLRLAARFADPDHGRILLGGIDLRQQAPDAIARRLGWVSQDAVILDDSVAANIRLGRPEASDDQVRAAALAAGCADILERLPDGLHTRLAEAGQRLSGGQRQRLALARALLADPPALLLDEVSAFVDPWHEAAMQHAISRLAATKTVVVVSHRLDSVTGADQVVFLDRGRVGGAGPHDRLMCDCPAYARLWRQQQDNLHWTIRATEQRP